MKRHLTLALFKEHEISIRKLASMKYADIRDLWISDGEPWYSTAESAVAKAYDFNEPLYVKMTRRFLNESSSRPAVFYRQVDPDNQAKIFRRFEFRDTSKEYQSGTASNVCHEIIEFLAWISNMLGKHDILQIAESLYGSATKEHNERFFEYWQKKPIKWFLNLLTDVEQQSLFDKYNKTCLDAWNNYVLKWDTEKL